MGRQSFVDQHYNEGIRRVKEGDTYKYFYIKTNQPVSKVDMQRIIDLKLPPAWSNVWVSVNPKSPIQAVGTDDRDRKQYKYHETHIIHAEQKKFIRVKEFIKAIPKLEKVLEQHKKLSSYELDRVIVTMLSIVRELHMRVGKEVYARENKSYGVSSLRKIHMNIEGDVIKFRFKGKSNKRLSYTLNDRQVAQHLRLLLKLEGSRLFQWINNDGKVLPVTDVELNKYIQQHMGEQFTIKDFRSYAANYYFVKTLLSETRKRTPKNDATIKKNIKNAVHITAFYLRHTKAISKKSYVLNFALEMYQTNPQFFIDRIDTDPDDVLLEILTVYQKKVLKI